MMKADPRRRRQLPVKGPLVFWRLGQDGISHVGLVVVVNACVNPGCPCREVTLMVHRVEDQIVGVELKGSTIRFFFHKDDGIGGSEFESARVLLADLDLDAGHVEIGKNAAADARDESALAWLREELDGPVLDHIANQALRLKGLRPLARVEVMSFKRNVLVAFGEAYLHGRVDVYVIDGFRVEVLDVYCVEPGCSCTEMRFIVGGGDRDMGSIIVDLGKPERPRFDGHPVLPRLWQAIRGRYPSMDVFQKRAVKMKEAGPDIIAQAQARHRAAKPAISRNQPCPCGSGKKYKRCCIRKTVAPPAI